MKVLQYIFIAFAQDVQFQPMYITFDHAIDSKKKLKSLNYKIIASMRDWRF
jgi:hypothetical protein